MIVLRRRALLETDQRGKGRDDRWNPNQHGKSKPADNAA